MKFASLAGEDSGLVYDDFVNEAVRSGRSRVDVNEENRTYLSAETAEQINETAKALGLRVQFADSVRGGTANAQIIGDTILIEKDNPNPVLAIAGHEFGHRLQELAPEEYRRFRESILEGREQEVRDKAAQYAKQGVNVTYEEAMNEVANDQAGLLMDGGEVLDRFIEQHRSDRTLLQKMRDAIRSFIDKVTGKERKRLETAEGKLEAALNAAAREAKALQKKAAGDMMGKGKYSLKEDENNGIIEENHRATQISGNYRDSGYDAQQKTADTGRSGQNRQGVGSEVRSEVGSTVRREDFIREHRERGDRSVRLKGKYLYAYHEATETELNDDAKKTVEILKDLDIPYFTNTDGLHIYANGNTRTSTQSVTIHDGANTKIAVSANMETEGVATAYHEAFHFLRDVAPALRAKLQETIRENIVENKSYEAFSSRIAEAYQIPLDSSQRTEAQEAKFQEELNAYICGEIMAQNPGSEALDLIKDFVKNPEQLLTNVAQMYTDFKTQQKGNAKFSLKTDSQGRELSEEQQKFFKDSKVRDENGQLLVMYHGTRAENGDFTVFDYSKAVKKGGLGLKALGKGNYFTSNQLNGSERFGSRVIEAYLNVTNPFIYDGANGDTISLAEQVQKKTSISTQGMSADALQDAMRRLGYDGIVEYRRDGSLGIAVTFDSEQIKYTTNQKPTSDPDIRYSLKNVDGEPLVWIEDNSLTNKELNDRKTIAAFISKHIGEVYRILESGQRVYIGKDLPGEYTSSKYTSYLRGKDRPALRAKNKAAGGLGELIEIASNRRWEQTRHTQNKDAAYGMYRYDSTFAFPVKGSDGTPRRIRAYDVELLIRNASDGKKYLYDIVNIKENTTAQIDLTQREARSAVYQAATGDDVSTDSISEKGENVNTNLSLKTGTITKSYEAVLEENRLLREQMKDYRSLKKQNRNLQENRDYWKGQTKTTEGAAEYQKAVAETAKELVESYSTKADVLKIQKKLQGLYDTIGRWVSQERSVTGDADYEKIRNRAESIAREIVEQAEVRKSPGDSYQELLDYLKTTKIVVGKKDQAGIPGINGLKARQYGRLNLSIQGKTNIDQVYLELADRWPEFFDEAEYTNPSDQLLQIADVADQLRQVEEYNPFEGDGMDQVVAGAANEILERFFDLPQTRKTFADRQEAKLNAAKAQGKQQAEKIREDYKARLEDLRQANRQRVADAIDKERAKRDQKIQTLKEKYAARDAAGRERRNARELRAKIVGHTSELSKKLLHPSDKHHIPEKLRTAVSAMLESINLESPYRVDENGKRQKGGSGSPTRRTAAFLALKEQYARIAAEGGDIVIDPALFGDAALDIQGGFDAVISMKTSGWLT